MYSQLASFTRNEFTFGSDKWYKLTVDILKHQSSRVNTSFRDKSTENEQSTKTRTKPEKQQHKLKTKAEVIAQFVKG